MRFKSYQTLGQNMNPRTLSEANVRWVKKKTFGINREFLSCLGFHSSNLRSRRKKFQFYFLSSLFYCSRIGKRLNSETFFSIQRIFFQFIFEIFLSNSLLGATTESKKVTSISKILYAHNFFPLKNCSRKSKLELFVFISLGNLFA